MMKDFWNNFTTRFAVPVLIVTQVITLYDGWESRVNERSARQQLIDCIVSHVHIVGEVHELIDNDGNKIIFDDTEFDGTVDQEHLAEIGCYQFALGYQISEQFTTQRTMDRWLGKVFYTYKNHKDRFRAWWEMKFRQKMLEDIRG
jgi:hypothetical protein